MKKCKNFLVTLIKLASSDPQAGSMATNVRGLVRALLVRLPPRVLQGWQVFEAEAAESRGFIMIRWRVLFFFP